MENFEEFFNNEINKILRPFYALILAAFLRYFTWQPTRISPHFPQFSRNLTYIWWSIIRSAAHPDLRVQETD